MTQNTPSYMASDAGATQAGASKFPNPFCDIASLYIPQNIVEAFSWTEYLMTVMAPFSSVVNRVVSYFLTEIDITADSGDIAEKYEDMLDNHLHIMDKLKSIGMDYFAYGNSFISLYLPFNRFLECPRCGVWYHSKTIPWAFDSSTIKFSCKCPNKKCGYDGVFEVHDVPDVGNKDDVRIIRWNPKRMHIKAHPVSGKVEYEYDLEQEFVQHVRNGSRFYIESAPMDVLETCAHTSADASTYKFKFNDGAIHHMKEHALAGLPIRGWGIPPLLPYFKLAYYIQLMRRYDEAIALDFIVPFRVLYPQYNGPQGQDALTAISMRTFIAEMQRMLAKKRRNITTYEVAPFPLGYQLLGGEAKQLAPKDSIKEAMDELLNALGIPQELFAGTLTLQAAPVALRLFERQFNVLVDNFNVIVKWLLDKLATFFNWAKVDGQLSPITLADDLERKGMQMQAAAGMDVSKTTAYKAYGIDYAGEQEKILAEQKEVQKLQLKAQADEQAATQNGASGAEGGLPSGAPGADQAGATPMDVQEQAKAIAQQLLYQTPPTQVRGQLIKIKNSNPTLHALVKQNMEQMRSDARSQGGAMVMEQQRNQPMQ